MKKRMKEFIIFTVLFLCFYLLPFVVVYISKGAIVLTIFINIFITFILSIILGIISNFKLYYLYPIIIIIMYIPSIFIFYNDSAIIYSLFHFIVSFIGIGIGKVLKW